MKVMSFQGTQTFAEAADRLKAGETILLSTEGESGKRLQAFVDENLETIRGQKETDDAQGPCAVLTLTEETTRSLGLSDDVWTPKSMALGTGAGGAVALLYLAARDMIGRPELAIPIGIAGLLGGAVLFPALKEVLPGTEITPTDKGLKVQLGTQTTTVKRTVKSEPGKAEAPKQDAKPAAPATRPILGTLNGVPIQSTLPRTLLGGLPAIGGAGGVAGAGMLRVGSLTGGLLTEALMVPADVGEAEPPALQPAAAPVLRKAALQLDHNRLVRERDALRAERDALLGKLSDAKRALDDLRKRLDE